MWRSYAIPASGTGSGGRDAAITAGGRGNRQNRSTPTRAPSCGGFAAARRPRDECSVVRTWQIRYPLAAHAAIGHTGSRPRPCEID